LPESGEGPAERTADDGILKVAAAKGISVNVGANDFGNTANLLTYADVWYPASSPYATAIGGVTTILDQNKHIALQTAWGTNLALLSLPDASGNPQALDPPIFGGFDEGGGGGVSNVYPLPPWQAQLRAWGNRRLLPDVSWLADPLTGVPVIITVDTQGDLGVIISGGVSLATPMFSGLWAIAAQKAHRPLGQAAPRLYALPPWAFMDVLPVQDSPDNVTGTLTDASGTQQLTAEDLALPLQGQRSFRSALWNAGDGGWFVVTFGTDTTLPAAPGWDPATGLGVPNGVDFINAVAP